MSLLELKDVTMAYGGKVKALDNVNLKVEKGDWLAVMGPSGSGKTTLMNIIGCMDHATSGTVLLDGIDITKVSDHELTLLRRDKIGIVFQQFHMIPYLTAIENIMAAQYYHSIPDKKEALEALDRVGLADRADHLPSQLSGGEQQRVCIARAIACRSELILFDEAVSSLDAHTQVQIMDLLLDLKEKLGLTYIFITHDLTSITYFCSRVIFLKDGSVVADSPVSELSKLDVPYAKELLGAVLDFNAESA